VAGRLLVPPAVKPIRRFAIRPFVAGVGKILRQMARLLSLTKMILSSHRGRPLPTRARPEPAQWSNNAITGSCLGHSTVLLNLFGVRLLTDPVFSSRVGLGRAPLVLGPKRHYRAALGPREFSPPDVIVLSHAHFDHFDISSLRRFSRDTPIVTAVHTADLLRAHGFRDVHELAWGQSVELAPRGERIGLQALEVAHWGARLMKDHHRGYNAYLIERDGGSVVFGGDTAYTPAFRRLPASRAPDLMVMPIGAYDPWIRAHCSPEQAVEMAHDAGARTFVPIHHETFRLSAEPMDEPARRLRAALAHVPERLLAVHVGETFSVPPAREMPGALRPAQRRAA
jgi:L-ascorbate metabolism protein UlaG (beta-lactamase superfamily)